MKKIFPLSLIVMIITLLFFNVKLSKAADFNYGDSQIYQSIVKLKVFGLNQYNYLSEHGSGSGVIISSDGLVLTNYHVVNIENSYDGGVEEEEVVINVCLNLEANKEPVCHHQAKLIAQDKDMDIALLKIEAIAGLNAQTTFQAITLSESIPVNSSPVMALGFPAIGGDSLTMTQGIVSGQIEKFNQKWIKTDAEISFGNSGGALINSSGELIGISSSVYADKLGSIGYALDINSIKPWLEANRQKVPKNHAFLSRLQTLVKAQKDINNANSFTWSHLGLAVTKATDWEFDYSDESSLYIDKPSDQAGGSITFKFYKFPFNLSTVKSDGWLDYLGFEHEGLVEFKNQEKISIAGQESLRFAISFLGDNVKAVVFPKDNFLVMAFYDYGQNNKDKVTVDNIVSSIAFKEAMSIEPAKYYYSDSYHNFSLSAGGDWLMQAWNDSSNRLIIFNKNSLSYKANISIKKSDDINNADKFIADIESSAERIGRIGGMMNLAMDIKSLDKGYYISDDLASVARAEFDITDSQGNLKFSRIMYAAFKDDDIYQFSLSAATDEANFDKLERDFLAILKTFKYNAQAPAVQVDYSAQGDDKSTVVPKSVPEKPINNVPEKPITNKGIDQKLSQRLAGKILLQVESRGEAWYVDKKSLERFYLKDGASAYQALRLFGLGVSNENLNKIPVAVDKRLIVKDSDADGLDDNLEIAIGTDPLKADTDGDGFLDGVEVANGYNPLGGGKTIFDQPLIKRLEGQILLQIEGRGEAWYVHEGKRYYLANGDAAYQVMRFLSIGIANENLEKIAVGAQSAK
jgi:S1-C subfamily serine protease